MLGYLYLNILQAVQIFGAETWVVNPRIRRVLGGFHHQVARQIAGKQLWRLANRSWDHPPMEEATPPPSTGKKCSKLLCIARLYSDA